MATIAEQLDAAADLLEKGWTQYEMERGGSVCLFEALLRSPDDTSEARQHLLRMLGVNSLIIWNDAPGRTQAEVVAAVRAGADVLRLRATADVSGMPQERVEAK